MKKLSLIAAAFAALFTGPTLAADLARPAPVYAPVPVVPIRLFTWTGCYIGANGGGLWARRDWSDPVFGFGDFGNQTASGGLGGVQGGCDYQWGQWVFGVAGDYDWSGASTSNAVNVFPGFPFTDQAKVKSLASVTFRTGYAWDRALLYVKGGGAWLKTDLSLQFFDSSVVTLSDTRNGWTVGVGAEYAFLNWLSGFIEYDYYNFRSNTDNFACTLPGCPGLATGILPVNVSTNVNVIKAGLNFRFGPGSRW